MNTLRVIILSRNIMPYRCLLIELLQLRCRSSIPVTYSSTANHIVHVKIGSKMWKGAAGNYYDSKEDAARKAYFDLLPLAEDDMRKLLSLPPRLKVEEIDEIRDIVKSLKRKVKTDYRLERQSYLLKKIIAIYNVIDVLECEMHK